jgi:phosphohistidine swiveling domain-containing protein
VLWLCCDAAVKSEWEIDTLAEFVIEIATPSKDVVDGLVASKAATVTTTRNLTGEIIVVLSVGLPIATALIREVGNVLKGRQATIRAQKLKIGKGTMSFDGFSADEIGALIDKLRETDLGGRS